MSLQTQTMFAKRRFHEPTQENIDKRRAMAEQRKERIFDPKARLIGIDKDALDAQLEEKAAMRQMERNRDEYFAAQAVAMDQHALFLAAQEEVEQRYIARDVENYRKTFQKKQAQKEWDFNDPKFQMKGLPARVSDADPRCGVASMQKFAGEDVNVHERRRKQQEQQKKWVQMQQDEKNLKAWLETQGERKHQDRADELNHRAWELENTVTTQRKLQTIATANFNKALGQQKRQEKMSGKRQETLNNYEEIRNQLDSDMLTENPLATINPGDPTRYRSSNMKGFNPEACQAVLNEQATQRDELRSRRLREAEEEAQWAQSQEQTHNLGLEFDKVKAQMRAEGLRKLNEDRALQIANKDAEKRAQTARNCPDIGDEWWGKFNQTIR